MCKAIDKKFVCFLSNKVGLLVASLRILGRFFQIFFTWAVGGRVNCPHLVTFRVGASYCLG